MENPVVDPEACTGCGICVDLCPEEAIDMDNGIAKIIDEKCSNCRTCVDECPTEAIS